MSSDREAFVQEIAAHPDDDAPRLIYADWLEERGDPQGQFIRVQCELARMPDSARWEELLPRETELLRLHRDEWLRPLGGALLRGVFHRGVLDQIEVQPQAFLEHHAEWFRLFPLTTLQLNLRAGPLKQLVDLALFANIPQLRQIRSLRLSGSALGDESCIRLLSAPNIGPLQELWLTANDLGPPALRWLANSPLARSLEVLILSGNQLGEAGRNILAKGPRFTRLRRLYISDCGISRRDARKIQSRHPMLEGVSCP
jgi:uncharacterized protein (TIGR02996 family)